MLIFVKYVKAHPVKVKEMGKQTTATIKKWLYLGCGILSGLGDGWWPDASHHQFFSSATKKKCIILILLWSISYFDDNGNYIYTHRKRIAQLISSDIIINRT